MNAFLTKMRLLTFVAILLFMGVQGQNPRFIYIQTDSKEPFYVKIDELLLNSSATGFILIPKLVNDTYELIIGFPDKQFPEKKLMVHVNENGTAYLLKKTNENNWSLDYLKPGLSEKMEPRMPLPKEFVTVSVPGEFARILAEVVNDPSIAQKTVLRSTAVTMAEFPNREKPGTGATPAPIIVEPAESTMSDQVPADTPMFKTAIDKLADDLTGEGILLTYVDKTNGQYDTVKLFIPVKQPVITTIEDKQPEVQPTIEAEPDARFIDMELQNPNLVTDSNTAVKDDFVIKEKKKLVENMTASAPQKKGAGTGISKAKENTGCKKNASSTDFLALRRRMAANDNEQDMLKTANMQFAKTCFNTEQIKNLGVLFIIEEERYKFFVAAYSFVSDKNNFQKLEEQLKDTYYKDRFKAMLGL